MEANETKEGTDEENSVINSILLEIIEDNETKEKSAKIMKDECCKKNLIVKNKKRKWSKESIGVKNEEHSLIASTLISMIRDKKKKEN